jgi:voltage-gated potassium channel
MLFVPVILLLIGTVGYHEIEGPDWSWLDAAYMAVITLTTVGFGEVHKLSPSGRIFTIVYCLGGIFTLYYVALDFIRSVVSGEIGGFMGRRRMERSLAAIRDHFIVCGYGRMGRYVCKEFEESGLPYVVIDLNGAVGSEFPTRHGIFIEGDATSDKILNLAGVNRARGLVTVADSDADNLYIVLSARLLNEKLFIVARSEEEAAEEKLRRVGANRVISPYVIGGSRVAQAILRPTVVDFIDLATRANAKQMQIEEIRVQATSELVGQSLAQRKFHEMGLVIAAIKGPEGDLTASPSGEKILEADCTLVVIGSGDQLKLLERLAAGPAKNGL